MKKNRNKLKSLALLGMSAGLAVSCGSKDHNNNKNDQELAAIMTEEELLAQLNDQARMLYMELDAEGQILALELASQKCAGQNKCAGLNSCRSDENACAGMAGCSGHSKGPFADKNLAVKVAAKHMQEKRSQPRQDQRQRRYQSDSNDKHHTKENGTASTSSEMPSSTWSTSWKDATSTQ